MKEYQIFEKYKLVIVNEIVREFGIENQGYIRKMFNEFKIVLETLPWEEYQYCKDNLLDKSKYYYEYIKLERLKKKIYSNVIKGLLDDWIEIFIDLNKNNNYDKISKLFYGDKQLIDYFSNQYELILRDNKINDKDIAIIIKKRKYFISLINRLGYKIRNLDSKMVDVFIKYREMYFNKIIIKNLLDVDNNYVVRISKIIGDNSIEIINELMKKENPTCFKYIKNNGDEHRFVYLPVNRLRNNGNKGIDVILVHEMIHYIQEIVLEEVILDEVLVQYKASKIVEKLHNKGIFVFDKEEDFRINGECIYEVLYPFVNKIIEIIPKDILSGVIIKDNYYELEKFLGDKISEYIIILNKLYEDFVRNGSFSEENLDRYQEWVKKLENSYDGNNYKVRIRCLEKK